MSALDLKEVLEKLFSPFGKRFSNELSRAASLVLAFMPWSRQEIQLASEAARLRGINPKRQPLRYISGLMIPVSLRSLERARHSAEALQLRDVNLH